MYRVHSFNKLKDFKANNWEVDSTPEDFEDGVIEYCKEFMNTHFYGEKKALDETDFPQKKRNNRRKISLTIASKPYRKSSEPNIPMRAENDTLATLLKIFHSILTSPSTPEGYDCLSKYIVLLATTRKRENESIEICVSRLKKDYEEFLHVYEKKAACKLAVSDQHWGSCQQLRCGKVITDYLDDGTKRAMDPAFGVLLCPYGGQIDGEDEVEEIEKYHRVMFDAFNFLRTYHGKGPGSDYLGSLTLLEPDPLEPEENCRLFWRRMIDRYKEEGIEVKKKMY